MNIVDIFNELTCCADCAKLDVNEGGDFCGISGEKVYNPERIRCSEGLWLFRYRESLRWWGMKDWLNDCVSELGSVVDLVKRKDWPQH